MLQPWTTFVRPAKWVGDFLPKLVPHQQQGTLDGACGFYCVSMILDYWEVCDPENVSDGRTSLARFLKEVSSGPLLNKGLTLRELMTVIEFFTPTKMGFKIKEVSDPSRALSYVQTLVSEAKPAILKYQVAEQKYAHYSVTVGTGDKRIFLMDPAFPAVEGSLYNNKIVWSRRDHMWDINNLKITDIGPCAAIYREGFEPDQESLWLPRRG